MSQTFAREINIVESLNEFQEFIKRGNIEAVRAVIDQRDSRADKLFELIPMEVARLALLMRTPVMWDGIISGAPEKYKADLLVAKKFTDEQLFGIEAHPGLMRSIRDQVLKTAERQLETSPLTEFGNFMTYPLWFESNESLMPIVSLLLRDQKEKLLLRVQVDWDDLSFLASCTVTALLEEMKRANRMCKATTVELPYSEKVMQRLGEIEAAAGEMRVLAKELGMSERGSARSADTIAGE